MFCGKCGKEMPDGAVACPACGAPTDAPTGAAPTPPPQGTPMPPPPPKAPVSKGKVIGLSILSVIVLFIVGLIVWAFIPNDKTRIEDELYRIMEEEYHANTDLFSVEKVTPIMEGESKEGEGALYAFTIRTCGGDLQSGVAAVEKKKDKERTIELIATPRLFDQVERLNLK